MWITPLLPLQVCQLKGGFDPLIHQIPQPRVGAHLFLGASEVLLAHELTAASAVPRIAQLMIRPVALLGIVLAAAARRSAHVVLAGERAGPQRTERGDLGLDRRDAVLKGRARICRHAGAL